MLKVGFDLDGVILYNPARILRPLVYLVKKLFFKKKLNQFWIPQKNWQKTFWRLAHKTSIFIAPGFDDIKKLVKDKKIKAYLITGRFSYLKDDLDRWLKKLKIDRTFSGIYYNQMDEQPHFFKERTVKKLGLDIFVEDNWDIVNYLYLRTSKVEERSGKTSEVKKQCKIFWIYNIFDKKIDYQYKFPILKKVVSYLAKK